MMWGYGFGMFGMIFLLVYLVVVVYFFYLLSTIARSLQRIADRLERLPLPGETTEQRAE
ncbi:hypothetical protein [Thermosinus carboxydivorans]|uniref:hypothetical protein n=1 Tax=Thermosinus carboxydivorans TaxID=261685 RepID=UPI0002D2612A|nr:hypothetical protein [Thermosinus carboxydivorans]